MIKRLIAVAAVLSIMSLYGCSKDCEVCYDYLGVKQCQTVKDVKKSDCEDCNDIGDLGDLGDLDVTCKVK